MHAGYLLELAQLAKECDQTTGSHHHLPSQREVGPQEPSAIHGAMLTTPAYHKFLANHTLIDIFANCVSLCVK